MSHHTHEHDHHHHHPHDHPHALDVSPGSVGRRGFLKFAGFTLAGTALAGCRRPVEKAIPLLVQPEEITPGRALWYASTCGGCSAGCGVLVKNRDGRPIKLEGNPQHPLSQGGLCAIGQACVVGLYDSHRLADPLEAGKKSAWPEVDRKIVDQLDRIRKAGGVVRLLTGTLSSPTAQATIDRFLAAFQNGRHVVYDALSCSAILDAHEKTHGTRVLPRYRFDRADVIVSLDADFLGTWISPVEFTAGYRARRKIEGDKPHRSHHVQFESRLSLTGANADRRIAVAPSEYGVIAASLASAIAQQAGTQLPATVSPEPMIAEIAARLWEARGRSLVVCGTNDLDTQIWVNLVNHLLGNYGATVDVEQPSHQAAGDDRAIKALTEELAAGQVNALIIHGVNPVYDLPNGSQFADALRKMPLVIHVSEHADETSKLAHFVCPEPHFLERWGDAQPAAGVLSVTQPVIQRLGRTRTLTESLHAWMGRPQSDYDIQRQHWEEKLYPLAEQTKTFQAFWDQSVHDGYAAIHAPASSASNFAMAAVPAAPERSADKAGERHPQWLVLYPKVTMREGRHAHNPWLQELPDPISRLAWDNYANLSRGAAKSLGVAEGDVIGLAVAGSDGKEQRLELPVHIQAGQHDSVIAVALGYGRAGTERFAEIGPQWIEAKPSVGPDGRVGRNAAPFLAHAGNQVSFVNRLAGVHKLPRSQKLAAIQTYDSLTVPEGTAPQGHERRDIVREISLPAYAEAAARGPQTKPAPPDSMWTEHRYDGHRWGMAIDLDACTGCGGCVLACQIENNVPVVGKDEMARSREMHWLRIDRYYEEPAGDASQGKDGIEGTHAGDISVSFQPMLCHHCENAPCETVCPVLATVHSSEGLNQQVYNRCVGTRYCANNCPYKMRRFNWFDYAHDNALENMILNPDVTVRSRGVMEKCSFCVQRIELAKIEARRQGVPVKDGDVQAACQQSCPARAIVFGDMNDPNSEISRLQRSPRYYRVLEELNVRPAVGYLMVVREAGQEAGGAHHG